MVNGNESQKLIEVKSLKKYYPIQKGFLSKSEGFVKAVDNVDLYINQHETLGLVGESGCGKSTLGKCILRGIEPSEGEIKFRVSDDEVIDIMKLNKKDLRSIRKDMQMVFQNPYSSLDPRMTILDIIAEPLILNNMASGKQLVERVKYLMNIVGLELKHLNRYPHAFSGGQRQRICIARALAVNPKLIVADEAVSALDVSIQAQILNLLQDLQSEFDLTYLFISHGLSVVEHISDRVAVMYVGKMVEMAETEEIYNNPKHPYTEILLASIPRPDPTIRRKREQLMGEIANPANPPSGCYFHPRCKYAEEVCKVEAPKWEEVEKGHFVACHMCRSLKLRGVKDFLYEE